MIRFALQAKSPPDPGAWYVTGLLGWTDDPATALTFATPGQAGRFVTRFYHLLYAVDVVPVDVPAPLPHTRRQPPAPAAKTQAPTPAELTRALGRFRRALASARGGPR